jgi:hypothetical protein
MDETRLDVVLQDLYLSSLILDKLKTIILRNKSRKSYELFRQDSQECTQRMCKGRNTKSTAGARDSGEIFKAESARLAVAVLFQLSLAFPVGAKRKVACPLFSLLFSLSCN